MDNFSSLLLGFEVIFNTEIIIAAIIGVCVGTLIGVLPGIGTTGGMALLLPITFTLNPTAAIVMLAAIYYGAMYGGSTTSILVNVPGEAASVMTTLDGHPMARKGRAGAALAITTIASFIAGTFGVVALSFFAPVLSRAALAFGPPEYFAIALLGLIILSNLVGNQPMKSMLMVLFGVMISTIGLDQISGVERLDFGVDPLLRGISFTVIAMGVFGISEILYTLTKKKSEDDFEIQKIRIRDLYPTKQEMKSTVMPIARGGIVGFLVGLLPGPAATLGTFSSYALEKKVSEHPEEIRHVAIEGIAGPESANNAASSATMVPLLSLGLPFSPPMALLLSGFIIHGITPGPSLITQHPDMFWGLIASMYIGNVFLVIINLPFVGVFASLLKIPIKILMPIIIIISFTGAFAVNYSVFDLFLLLLFGVFAFFVRDFGFSMAPLAVGVVLGPVLEEGLVQGLIIGNGNFIEMVSRPIAGPIIGIAIAVLLFNFITQIIKYFRKGVVQK